MRCRRCCHIRERWEKGFYSTTTWKHDLTIISSLRCDVLASSLHDDVSTTCRWFHLTPDMSSAFNALQWKIPKHFSGALMFNADDAARWRAATIRFYANKIDFKIIVARVVAGDSHQQQLSDVPSILWFARNVKKVAALVGSKVSCYMKYLLLIAFTSFSAWSVEPRRKTLIIFAAHETRRGGKSAKLSVSSRY